MTLRLKILLLVAGVVVLATSGVTAVALWREVTRGQALLAREGAALAGSAATAAAHWLGPDGLEPGGVQALPAVAGRLLAAAPLEQAWIVDRAGVVVACASRGGAACPPGLPPAAPPAADQPGAALARLARAEPLVASAPVLRGGEPVGAVRVAFTHEEVVGNARELAAGASLVGALWMALGLLLGHAVARRLTRPLETVAAAAAGLAEERAVRLEEPEERELAELVRAFNGLAARLGERREENLRLIAGLEERVREKTREVLRADRLATLGGIAAGLAHELGNSLNVIRGFSAVAARELPEGHPNRPDVEAIRRETGRAAALLERFLVFARARDGAARPEEIEPLLREVIEVVGPAAAQAGVEREIEVAAPLPPVVADAGLLRQAFLNLAVNAVQAMASAGGGRLVASARAEGGQVVVELRDTGPGLPPEVAAHAFEPFFTTKPEGTGLGLAIVRQAVEACGGTVELEGGPGTGAAFRVRLPAARAQGAA